MNKHLLSKFTFFVFFFIGSAMNGNAQTGFVHASGTRILDNQGNNIIFRGIGTGNWMLQEGYMMGTSGATNGTQWHFRQKLEATIGRAKTDEFYETWLDNHFTKADVDSMAKWGYNSVRVAMHYKVFTLPIEQEPVKGRDTWLESGFVRLDNLLQWCADNKIYLILDMHGCPGAQGSDSNISDYDSSKPSLWEDEENKRKLVALWKKLAERYADSPWIGGYDLINEPKWDALQANQNKALWDLFKRIIDTVREVDKNHLIFLAGNNWGNDYNGLPDLSGWGGNLALSFHKYWNGNGAGAIDWAINMGNSRNMPVWLGETGENSNTWFADAIRLCESKNVGWAMWPVKKTGNNNIMSSKRNTDYDYMLNEWRAGRTPNADRAYNGVMQFAEDHNIKNCFIRHDVIDAMITRPHTNETRPFKPNTVNDIIFASDYDLGNPGYAYYDVGIEYNDRGNGADGQWNWNQGGAYRNEGVDMEYCSDTQTNGYNVSHTEDGEWLCYTIESPEEKSYTLQFRYSSLSGGGRIYVEINGQRASPTGELPATGGWENWSSAYISDVVVPQGTVKVKLVIEKSGFNLNWFAFTRGKEVEFNLVFANTHLTANEVQLNFSKEVTAFSQSSFACMSNNEPISINQVTQDAENKKKLLLILDNEILNTDQLQVSYIETGTCKNEETEVGTFSNFPVDNVMATLHRIPCKVEAEDYLNMNSFTFEDCLDTGGGLNAGYTSAGSYLDFFVYSRYAGKHQVDVRVAVNSQSRIQLQDAIDDETSIGNIRLEPTGGWQNWETQSIEVPLRKGKNILRLYAVSDGFNINWIEIKEIEGAGLLAPRQRETLFVFLNPVSGEINVQLPAVSKQAKIILYDMSGRQQLQNTQSGADRIIVNASALSKGVYILQTHTDQGIFANKIVLK